MSPLVCRCLTTVPKGVNSPRTMNRSRHGWMAWLVVAGALVGCQGPGRAKMLAAAKSGCDAEAIQVVHHDNTDLVLDVCGVHEQWKWHAVEGWEYRGPAASQPAAVPASADMSDQDGDGVLDAFDACVHQAGPATSDPATNGCPPPPDSDGDAIPDSHDACPHERGLPNADPALHGCPAPGDSDGDGITDDRDACPQVAGKSSPDPAKHGCPQDADGDGIEDDQDACPNEVGVPSEDPRLHGCPEGQEVTVTTKEIVLANALGFVKGAPSIATASKPTLDALAQALKDRPEARVEITAYADGGASEAAAATMSEARAAAVKKALVERGVDEGRLTTKAGGTDGSGVRFAVGGG
jgi:outer membrane protein OmpA-like peptidoglycan-associated protein